ncbi:unnamed protein product [Discosporangium mesarthrocarpum]
MNARRFLVLSTACLFALIGSQADLVLNESFSNPSSIKSHLLSWRDEPKSWKLDNGKLEIEPDPETDYWQKTYYKPEIRKARGAQLGLWLEEGDVVLETAFTLRPVNRFDQAGVLIRASDTHWVKAGIEFSDGAPRLSVVLTSGASTWSVQPWEYDRGGEGLVSLALRLYRIGDDIVVEARHGPSEDDHWDLFAIGRVEGIGSRVFAGLSALAPTTNRKQAGSVSFDYLRIWRCPSVGSCYHHTAQEGGEHDGNIMDLQLGHSKEF